jgi:hypothetical protein
VKINQSPVNSVPFLHQLFLRRWLIAGNLDRDSLKKFNFVIITYSNERFTFLIQSLLLQNLLF